MCQSLRDASKDNRLSSSRTTSYTAPARSSRGSGPAFPSRQGCAGRPRDWRRSAPQPSGRRRAAIRSAPRQGIRCKCTGHACARRKQPFTEPGTRLSPAERHTRSFTGCIAYSQFSILKRRAKGVFNGFCQRPIQRYLDEFVFRWNRRRHLRPAFDRLLGIGVGLAPTTYRDIVEHRA